MSAQSKRYLQLADQTTEPRSKLFYKLMADVAPIVNNMGRKQVNQVGASIWYEIVLRLTSALLVETAFNLSSERAVDLYRLTKDFRIVLEHAVESQQILQAVPVTPKMQS